MQVYGIKAISHKDISNVSDKLMLYYSIIRGSNISSLTFSISLFSFFIILNKSILLFDFFKKYMLSELI